jgi:predicted transcriptional regulator
MLSHSPDDTAASILTFRCPPQLRAKIERQAATEYQPLAAVIRRAVAHYLEAQEANRPTAA